MVKKIDHENIENSRRIYSIFQVSYKVEAELLNMDCFPPLNRNSENILTSDSEFYAFWKKDEVVGLVEIFTENEVTDIQSLVVHPQYFRQGIGMELVTFITNAIDSKLFVVETGIDNFPAVKLYGKLGFIEKRQWETKEGIIIVRFEKGKRK